MFELKCGAQNYAWGKLGDSGIVGKVFKAVTDKLPSDFHKMHFAEYWMGTHVSAPSSIKSNNTLLTDHLKQYTAGAKSNLSFLFKVLSVNTALSIQAHPHKELAAKLNKESPELYKDANHKPEMALALTPFEALYGFLPQAKLLQNLEGNEVFKTMLPAEHLVNFKEKVKENKDAKEELKILFKDIFEIDLNKEKLREAIEELIKEINGIPEEKRTVHQNLALELFGQYGYDVGILVTFMMNYLKLSPGDAIAIQPNEPHAYLSGDSIECMATSDNVVRCGLTPKIKDAKTLIEMLTYNMAEGCLVKPLEISQKPDFSVRLYDPKFKEFVIHFVRVASAAPENKLELTKWSIMIALKGNVCLTRIADKAQIRAIQYSAWILEPNVYHFAALEEPAELCIASEGPI